MKRTHRNEKRAPKASDSPSAFGLLIISLFPYCPVKFSVSSPRTGRSNSPAKASEGGERTQGDVVSASTLRARFPPTPSSCSSSPVSSPCSPLQFCVFPSAIGARKACLAVAGEHSGEPPPRVVAGRPSAAARPLTRDRGHRI
jgi:hypothetical protein